ncbi:uncharacterized protein LOC18423282 [Amborella trichopoda]|uniref:Magnesium-transporting ATPase, P-type 1 n=1 Tax=Amborella trichopoda TaxID=13333 RepID=W1NIM9_AMBTC|nr:uncharacterized protein LOC18423282 [Amborella trichopoda]ERM95363.1 hypothetical protein AMTR_s00008p00194190 [Amborella trichopoda]|eukprot:XP_006827947.1 uncharacterized protein LOC18423282 [Amborella trichopoda]
MGISGITKVLSYNGFFKEETAHEVLITGQEELGPDRNLGFRNWIELLLRKLIPGKKFARRSEDVEKVHSWLRTLSQTDRDLVFEYVGSTERGLSFKEADRRLKEVGRNIPLDITFPRWWKLLWTAIFHPFNIILFALASLSYLTSDNGNGSIMLTLVFVSVGLRFYQEFSSSKAAMKLSELLNSPVIVQRCAGRVVQTELQVHVDQREVVPGDIILFSSGDLFPGDVRLLTSKDLVVSQSSLTGESGTMEKVADIIEDPSTPLLELRNICFMGTSVIAGSGTGLVVSTGSKTYMSTIFSSLGRQKMLDSFEKGVRRVSYALICFMLLIVPIVVCIDFYSSHILSSSILFGISVAVGLTPQMLPLIVNTNLAKGALAMARDRCIVKSQVAIQNMGAMDIICLDKTGTLTMDRVILFHHLDGWGVPREKILHFAFLNSYFKTEMKNPIDDAILAFVYTGGYKFQPLKWCNLDEIPFSFARRRMSVILETNGNSFAHIYNNDPVLRLIITKGALEEVVRICNYIEDVEKGLIVSISSDDCQRILQMGDALSNDGLRVLGVATRRLRMVKSTLGTNNEALESDMVFLGILAFFDPPKDSVKQALWRLAERGVNAKVLTGDSLPLAIRICKEVGIHTSNVITGPALESLDQDNFHEAIKGATVLARLTPTQKLQVVQSLKTENHVVGFLGDGINDSLALEAADVGISVDSGASVAKDVADIILLEKDLNVLVAGVERGRVIHGNTMKYLKMSVVANLGSVVSLVVASVCLPFEPLSPMQLLTQNLLYNVSQIMIPWDKMDPEYISIPHQWSPKGIIMFMLWNGPVCSVFDMAAFVFLCLYYQAGTLENSKFFRSAWFVEGLLMQTLIIHMIRTEKIPFVQESASWSVICSTIIVSLVGIAFPFTPPGRVMGLDSLPLSYFGFLVVLFPGYFVVGQLAKIAYIKIFKSWL